jgi:parallel beta-helix repeat protein
MRRLGFPQLSSLIAVIAAASAWALLFCGSAIADGSCDRVAATNGNDSNPGTASAPFQTAQRLADSLSAGQTGCLRAGTYAGGLRVATSGVSVTSYPGERATISGKTYLTKDADHVTVSDLNLVSGPGTGEFVNGTGDVFDNVDVTSNNTENCFIVGSSDPTYGRASGLVIENSRIHDCGQLNPDTNGDHGIYVANADNTIIRDNYIYDNANRGIQLYPDARGTQVYGNVIDGNGEGIEISGDGTTASSNNTVENNVISNSKNRWNVESWWPNGVVGSGNLVRDNCLYSSNSDSYYNQNGGILPPGEGGKGFASLGNVTVGQQFAEAATRQAGLPSDSPCAGSFVTLRPLTKQVRSGGEIGLRGRATPTSSTKVTIQILRHGHWRKLARTTLRADGQFVLRARLRGHHGGRRARLRAKVPQVGHSRPVAVRVRR